jgi:hypothetical protein
MFGFRANTRGSRAPHSGLARLWRDRGFKRRLIAQPQPTLMELGIAIPADIAVKTVASKGAPGDPGGASLLEFVLERGHRLSYFFIASPQSPCAQQAAYGRILSRSLDDPQFEARMRQDAAAALRALGVEPAAAEVPR